MRFQIPITGRGKDSDIKANQVQEGQQNALFQAEQGLGDIHYQQFGHSPGKIEALHQPQQIPVQIQQHRQN